jgi:hypothetical protein
MYKTKHSNRKEWYFTKEHIIYTILMIIAVSLYCSEPIRLTVDCIVVMVDIVVFKITVPKKCNLLKLKATKLWPISLWLINGLFCAL